MKNKLLPLFAGAAIVSVCQAESYQLKIERPAKVGDKAEITVTGHNEMSQKVTVGGQVAQENSACESGSMEATREVLDVTEKGKPTKLKFTVKSLKYAAAKDAEPEEILAGGKVCTAEIKDEKLTFTLNGAPAEEKLSTALKLVVDLKPESKSIDADTMFNTKAPHAVGDEWDASLDTMLKSMSEDIPIEFDAEASTGKIKLEKIEKVAGIDCALVTGTINLAPTAMKGLPEGSKVSESTFKLTLATPVPVDATAPELGGKMQMDMAIKVDLAIPGGAGNLDMTGKMVRDEKVTPVK